MYISEIEKLRQKLKRAYMRRDHYAQLYYRVTSELDETRWELEHARNKIHQLRSLCELFVCLYVVRVVSSSRGVCMLIGV